MDVAVVAIIIFVAKRVLRRVATIQHHLWVGCEGSKWSCRLTEEKKLDWEISAANVLLFVAPQCTVGM